MAMQTGGGTARDRIMARARAMDDEEKKKQQAQQPQQTRQSARVQVPMRYRQAAQEPGQEAAQQPQTTARDRIQARARAMGQQRVMSGLGDLTVEEYQYALKQAEAASPKWDENPGFFSRVGKWLVGKTEKTPEEIVAEQWDALEAARKREELASLDLDEYEKLLEQAKKQAADARPDFNIHAMGAYDAAAENTQAKRKADEMQQTYNLAKQVQFERQGEQALAQLTPKQLEAVETLVQTPATGTSVMSAGVARENARDQAYSVLLEGGYSYKTISDLVTWRSRQQDKEAYQKTVQWHEDLADSGVLGGAAATVLSVPENLLSGVGAIDVALQKANQTGGEERPVNYYSAPMRLYGGANAARETVGQKLERNTDATIFGQNVASTAYGIGTSMLDSGATVALAAIGVPPVVGSSLLGGAAATGAMVDAKDRGVDDTHALWTGVFAGVAETLFEDVSLERLLKLDVPQGTLRQRMQTTLKNTLLQAGTEGSEELFTDFANYITDRAINGGLSEYDTAVRAYMDQGLSQKEASQKAGADLAARMALDFVAGGVAGGLMAGGKAAIDNAGQNREMRQYSDLAPAAAEERLAADPGSRAARRVQKQIQQGKPVSGAALRETMAQNVEAQNQAVTEQVRKLARQRLEELGDTQAEKTSRAVAQLYDQELPWYRRELARKALRSSEYGQRVANEMEDAVETGRVRTLLEQAGETEDAARVPRWTSGEWAENLPRYTSQGAYINQLMERRVNPAATDKRPVTGFRYNQETGQLDAIVKGEDGKVETIPKERAATTGRQEWLADLAADLKEAAPTMIASYMEGQDVQIFSRQWHNAYEYGAAGVKKDYAMNSQAVDQLNATQRELAYDAGAAARAVQQTQERMKFPQEGQDTGMTREGTVSLKGATVGGVTYAPVTQETMTRRQRDSVEVMRQLARVTGVDVVFYQSRANEKGEYPAANGFYQDGTVYLDINAGKNRVGDMSETAVLLTASHELTHFIQEYNPAQYEQLRDFVVERLMEAEDVDLDALVQRHQKNQPGLSYDEALDEVVADGCQMMLKDSQAAAALAKQNRSLAGNIRSWLRKWVKRLQEAMRGLTARSREARAMEQYARELQKIWDNALVQAAENRQRAQSGPDTGESAAQVRYEVRESKDKDIVSVKQQLKASESELSKMPVVSRKNVTADIERMSTKQRLEWAVAELRASGYRVERPNGNTIEFSPKDINSGLRYLSSAGEIAAYSALPAVLKRGKEIYREANHKGRGYGTITFAAPVEINGVRGNMAVVVRQTKGQRYDVHRILMPDGSAFIFREKANAVSTTVGSVTGDAKAPGEVRPTINTASTDSIRSSAGNSQEKFSVREAGITDRELLANALETTARNDLERGLLAQYQEKAKSAARWERWLDYHQQKLADHESGVHPLTTQQVLLAREKAAQYAEMLDQLDEKLLKIESMGPMRKLLGRERSYVDDLLTGAVTAEKEHFQAEFEQRLQEARRHEQESLLRYRQRREESERRRAVTAKIERTTRQLADRLNTNTDKKHIPEPLKKPVAQLLTALDYSSRSSLRGDRATRADQEYCRAMEGIRRVLADQEAFQQGAEGSEDALGGYLDLPPGLTDLMTKHIQTVENIIEDRMPTETVLRRMNLTQLRDLDVILSTVTRAVTKMNELLENRTFVRVADAAEDTMAELHRRGQYKGAAEKAETFVAWDNTLPWYAFQRFGEGGRAIFEELQDGWDKLAFNSKQVLDFRKGVITDEQARAWDTEVRRVELLDQEGETVTVSMTTAQLMGLYCLSKRKQALGHLFGGGIRITDIETRGKLRKKAIKQDEHYKMDGQMLGRLLGQLTPEQIAVADKLQKYMTEQGSKWGNEVTMQRFGYRGFTEKIYYPIETDSQDRLSRAGGGTEGRLYRLQNISAVKPLVQNANNAIMLRGIFDVFSNHMADMAKYNALVIPIVDAQKWYNYKDSAKNETGQVNTRTVQRAMTKAYGQSANRYVVQFLKDLNGVKESGARGEAFADKMISNYKRAAVAANLRVALLQPTAYVRAAAVLDYKYLAKAFGDRTGTRQATAEMLEHSGIALWKDMGFFDTDVGRSIRDQIKGKGSKLEDLVDKSMAAAELGDKVTWARLWRACKLEAQEKQGLSGDELIKATARRFRDVIYQTQVIDSTMTRSHMMRSSSTFSKMFTSFMSEPTVSYNLIMEGTRQILKDKKAMGLKTAIGRNWKTAGRAYQAYVVSALAAAVVESLADALRDDDDDTLWEKLWNAFGGLHGNLASDLNPMNKLPYMRDVFSALDGYDNGRMDTEGLANAKKAYDILMESYRLATGQQDKATSTTYYGNMTTYGKVYQTFRAVSMLSGLPLSAATREVITAWNNTVGSVWPGMKRKTYESKKLREAYNSYAKPAGISYDTLSTAMEYVATLESDKDAEGKTVSGSLKAKYVAYIQSLGLTSSQQKAMWLALKNSTWSDKGTPWA